MAYKHVWGRPMELPADPFQKFVDDVRLFCKDVRPRFGLFGGIRITGGGLLRRPVLTSEEININGWPPMRVGYEPFNLTRVYSEKYGGAYRNRKPDEDGLYWDYVQTNGNAYDVVVTAALLSLCHHVPECVIESDGDMNDWKPGIDLYQRTTHRDLPADYLQKVT